MSVTRRIYVSLPADRWLPKSMNDLKWAIVDEIENLGYTPEIFTNPRGKPGLASSRAWGARDADEVARRCVGAAIIGMARWEFKDSNGVDARLPTEFNHYEGALARTLGLPTLVLVQQDVMRRVVFDPTYGGFVGEIPPATADISQTDPSVDAKAPSKTDPEASPTDSQNVGLIPAKADPSWLKTAEFRVPFGYWRAQLYARRDVFLGYCSSSRATAASLKYFLQSTGATVLDWQTDFIAGRSILAQIEEAASRCSAGIFLFTKDDDLIDKGQPDVSAPRDNVVFEAGYFIGLKGKRNVLIIREKGSKMPADLGGDIYAMLPDRVDIGPIERVVSGFMAAL
jgi:Predicted nucleotide-binding protein containing TIR-like domain